MLQTIIFADNERAIRQYCKQELEADGFCVILAEDGEEVLSLLDLYTLQAVILDEHMPRCSGLEAARQIKQRYPHLPVILFTADEHYAAYRSRFVDAAVVKSEDLSLLKRTISQLGSSELGIIRPTQSHGPKLIKKSK